MIKQYYYNTTKALHGRVKQVTVGRVDTNVTLAQACVPLVERMSNLWIMSVVVVVDSIYPKACFSAVGCALKLHCCSLCVWRSSALSLCKQAHRAEAEKQKSL